MKNFMSSVKIENGPYRGQTAQAIVTDVSGNIRVVDTALLLPDMIEDIRNNILTQMQIQAERYANQWSKLGLDTVPELW